ncbi:hypothetical protein Tco_0769801 [Tanacetum coccineum]|uniref:NADH dehydrogenase subunit 6 n=1 Tax=Tanacetum coccineum TaxID=301880 RepID=A0ABQ4XS30_9ASTR
MSVVYVDVGFVVVATICGSALVVGRGVCFRVSENLLVWCMELGVSGGGFVEWFVLFVVVLPLWALVGSVWELTLGGSVQLRGDNVGILFGIVYIGFLGLHTLPGCGFDLERLPVAVVEPALLDLVWCVLVLGLRGLVSLSLSGGSPLGVLPAQLSGSSYFLCVYMK